MKQFRIKTINAIAHEGLALFSERFAVKPEETNPEGIVVRSSKVDLSLFPKLLAVARAGAGVNNIPVDEATEKGICVFNTPGANANAVVELVYTSLGIWLRNVDKSIEFCNQLTEMNDEEINREVEARKKIFKGEEMIGKTLAVIGLGKIGVGVANAGLKHGLRVLGFDPFPALDNIHHLSPGVTLARSRKEAVSQADFVTLHMPLNKNTKGYATEKDFLEFFKDGAVLINYSRGPIVDEDAVLAALDSGRLNGHISDFPSVKFLGHEKILLTPHLGASTAESEDNCAIMAVRELKGYLEYGNIVHSVNFPNIETIPTVDVHTRLTVINRDQPGMIGLISNILGSSNINIINYTNKSNGTVGYNIIDCAGPVAEDVQAKIKEQEGVLRVRIIPLEIRGKSSQGV
ncbi:phosphoglycerate dehydrogenase [Desulfobulbus alkaliphilus]|uniref:phosphoglycerate dehydrogenase n=1 Tax=Desulfobulbus alkaliphilus TaxID=869814 RepID=UPI0019666627|nr:phosphoglycerate dehydrogenase [Desulfobulbus alkaliphilus]MBM9536958.1 phosphoglycerate dehydrogenase [Desulfobulbus alkaliphilus]